MQPGNITHKNLFKSFDNFFLNLPANFVSLKQTRLPHIPI